MDEFGHKRFNLVLDDAGRMVVEGVVAWWEEEVDVGKRLLLWVVFVVVLLVVWLFVVAVE